jgi:hypothetical protein
VHYQPPLLPLRLPCPSWLFLTRPHRSIPHASHSPLTFDLHLLLLLLLLIVPLLPLLLLLLLLLLNAHWSPSHLPFAVMSFLDLLDRILKRLEDVLDC